MDSRFHGNDSVFIHDISILNSSPFTLHPSPFILHTSYFILHTSSPYFLISARTEKYSSFTRPVFELLMFEWFVLPSGGIM